MTPVLFVFLDGVGIGPPDPERNPFSVARLPVLDELVGGPLTLAMAAARSTPHASLAPLDATLGVDGLPQSGTGQTALLTGRNAARLLGRHFGPWTPTALRPLLAEESILARARAVGLRVAFANAYPEELFPGDELRAASARSEAAPTPPAVEVAGRAGGPGGSARPRRAGGRPLLAGPPLAARAAGLLVRHTPELLRGSAVASEITNDGWRQHLHRRELPVITADQAGRNLARIAADHDLTLFAHYATDTVGHRGGMEEAVAALERVDTFLGGILAELPDDALLIVASDHGNIEEIGTGHTRNPALGLVRGPGHRRFARDLHALTDVAPTLLSRLAPHLAEASASRPT